MAGRPTKYQPLFANVARVMTLEGSRPADIARALNVTSSTLHDWARKYPAFQAALRAADAETEKVVASVLRLAKGFTRKTVRPITITVGNGVSRIVDHPVVEYTPPNLQAALRWLKVQRPEIWGDAGHGTVKASLSDEGKVEVPGAVLAMLANMAAAKQSRASH